VSDRAALPLDEAERPGAAARSTTARSTPRAPQAGPGAPSAHRRDIDGLRAVAILPVVLYHLGLSAIPGGFVGVDVFFVISGFVIAGSVLSDLEGGVFSVLNFYFKRVRRILPAYGAVALVTAAVCAMIMLPDSLLDFGRSLICASLFVSNIYFWKTSGYFAPGAHDKPLLHMWSLSVEEQFYIFAPIAFFLIFKYGRGRWLLFLAPVLALSLIASIVSVFAAPKAGFFLLPTRAWELLLGACLALKRVPAPSSRLVREGLALLGFALIAFALARLHDDDPFPGWNALYPCLGAALIIFSGSRLDGAADRTAVSVLLSSRAMVGVGLISYSLYLVHWPIISLFRYQTLRDPTLIESLLMLGASFLLAVGLWRFVEQPFRRLGRSARTLTLSLGALGLLLGVGVGGALVAAHGLPQRLPGFSERHVYGNEVWGGEHCFNQNPSKPLDWSEAACTRIRGSGGRVLLWGDSFAAQYVPGLLDNAADLNEDVLQYTFAGCPPILSYFSYARLGCSVSNRRIPDLVRREHVDTVVIAALWTDVPKHTLQDLPATIATLRREGVRVVVIGQSPEFSADVQRIDYISRQYRARGDASWPVSFDPALNARIGELAKGAAYVDPLKRLCQGTRCPYRRDRAFEFIDYGHFSSVGSDIAVRAYFPKGRPAPSR